MHITPFEPAHILAMEIQPHQEWMRSVAAGSYGDALARGVSQTVWDGDEPIACMGECMLWDGNGEVWSVFARQIGTRMTYVHRATKRLIDSVNTRRLQAFVDAQFKDGLRWMFSLGFTVEGKLQHYFPNGNDAFLFARFKHAVPVPHIRPFAMVDEYEERDALARVLRLEKELAELPTQVHLQPVHRFTRGIYSRELTIPKGVSCTGKMHRHDHISFVTRGDISVFTGDGVKRYRAGDMVFSKAGTKRAVYAHEETTWVTVHGTNETDLEKLEAELIIPPAEYFPQLRGVQ